MRDDIGKLPLPPEAKKYARMTSRDAMSGRKPQMFIDMVAAVTNQRDRKKGFGNKDAGVHEAAQVVDRMLNG